jgi:hypothetical protein
MQCLASLGCSRSCHVHRPDRSDPKVDSDFLSQSGGSGVTEEILRSARAVADLSCRSRGDRNQELAKSATPDKGTPVARRGRKARDLSEAALLPKEHDENHQIRSSHFDTCHRSGQSRCVCTRCFSVIAAQGECLVPCDADATRERFKDSLSPTLQAGTDSHPDPCAGTDPRAGTGPCARTHPDPDS